MYTKLTANTVCDGEDWTAFLLSLGTRQNIHSNHTYSTALEVLALPQCLRTASLLLLGSQSELFMENYPWWISFFAQPLSNLTAKSVALPSKWIQNTTTSVLPLFKFTTISYHLALIIQTTSFSSTVVATSLKGHARILITPMVTYGNQPPPYLRPYLWSPPCSVLIRTHQVNSVSGL